MRRYSIQAKSEYTYANSVVDSLHRARLLPCHGYGQNLISSDLQITPKPTRRQTDHDFFGTTVEAATVRSPHDRLTLTIKAAVEVTRTAGLIGPTTPWRQVTEQAANWQALDKDSPVHYLAATRHTMADPAIAAFANRHFSDDKPIGSACLELAQWIEEKLAYENGVTTVETSASEAWHIQAGVCQDFSHIMIAICRSVGVPCRYVSGYICTTPAPGQPRLQGADAMHAWVSVWTGPLTGWVDYDPTNGCLVEEDHIIVGFGRDYQDVPPLRGSVVGGGAQDNTVAVDVIDIDL